MLQKSFFEIKCHKIEGMLVKTKILNNFEDHVFKSLQMHKITIFRKYFKVRITLEKTVCF